MLSVQYRNRDVVLIPVQAGLRIEIRAVVHAGVDRKRQGLEYSSLTKAGKKQQEEVHLTDPLKGIDGMASAAAARVPLAPCDVILADLEDIQHVYATNEFERQVLSRVSSKGFQAKQMSK